MLARILNFAGRRTGFITTVGFYDGSRTRLNRHGLSMPGGPMLQKQLRDMANNGCSFAVVECTSEGLAQNRHLGISFRAALLTNLSPAHQDAHGGFKNYQQAKKKLFAALRGQETLSGVNLDGGQAGCFLNYPAAKKFGISFEGRDLAQGRTYNGQDLSVSSPVSFRVGDTGFTLALPGKFNAYNALLAAACAAEFGVPLEVSARALEEFARIEGRMEEVAGEREFKVFVDYAPEPAGMTSALMALKQMPHRRIIHVFGSTGGHRDVAKRFEFGQISAGIADIIIITNDDVYDSDPREIALNIESGIKKCSSWKGQYQIVLDRRQAIGSALAMARAGDLVIITGKGSEQFLVLPGNKRIPWDDRQVVKEELARLPAANP
jgi:UDP-N-acetylmuramoyl-L-alanyl-D-glutamate--2,6-diaminopimelate ligase